MTGEVMEELAPFSRLALAVDASPLSAATTGQAVALAYRLDAHLNAICVEDPALARLAHTPCMLTVNPFGKGEWLDQETVKRLKRLQIESVKKALSTATKKMPVEYALTQRQGEVADAICEEAAKADLLILGWSGWQSAASVGASGPHKKNGRKRKHIPDAAHWQLGKTVCDLMEKSPVPLLVIRGEIHTLPPVATIFDGSEEAQSSLLLAARATSIIMRPDEKSKRRSPLLSVYLVSDSEEQYDSLKRNVQAILRPYGLIPGCHNLPPAVDGHDPFHALTASLRKDPGGIFVMPDKTDGWLDFLGIPSNLNMIPCSLLRDKNAV